MLQRAVSIFIILLLSACANTINRPNTPQPSQNQVPVYPLTSKRDIVLLQQRLKNRNFNPGGIDGKLGKNTTKAILEFQQANGYPADGLATSLLLQQLDPGYVPPSPANGQPAYDDSIVGESTAVSAGFGAAAGGILGKVLGNSTKDIALGAAAGAAVGAGTDIVANNDRVDHAITEHQLNLSIDQIRQENQRLQIGIDAAKKSIEEDKQKIQSINEQIRKNKLSRTKAKKKYEELNANRQLLQTTYNELLAKQKQRQLQLSSNKVTQEVSDEMNKLNQEIAVLKSQLDDLDKLRSISVNG